MTKEDARKQAAQTAAGIIAFGLLCVYLKQAFLFLSDRYGKARGVLVLLCSIAAVYVTGANILYSMAGEPLPGWGAVVLDGVLIAMLELKRSKYGEKAVARFGKKAVEIIAIVIALTLFYFCV